MMFLNESKTVKEANYKVFSIELNRHAKEARLVKIQNQMRITLGKLIRFFFESNR